MTPRNLRNLAIRRLTSGGNFSSSIRLARPATQWVTRSCHHAPTTISPTGTAIMAAHTRIVCQSMASAIVSQMQEQSLATGLRSPQRTVTLSGNRESRTLDGPLTHNGFRARLDEQRPPGAEPQGRNQLPLRLVPVIKRQIQAREGPDHGV